MAEVTQLHRLEEFTIQDNPVVAVLGKVSVLAGMVNRFWKQRAGQS